MFKKLINFIRKLFVKRFKKLTYTENNITIKGGVLVNLLKDEFRPTLDLVFKMLELSNVNEIDFDDRFWNARGKWLNNDSKKEFELYLYNFLKVYKNRVSLCEEPNKIRLIKEREKFIKYYMKNYTWKQV